MDYSTKNIMDTILMGPDERDEEEFTEKGSSSGTTIVPDPQPPELLWDLLPPPQPKPLELPNKHRFHRPYNVPRAKKAPRGKPHKMSSRSRFPLRKILFVPFLRDNPYVSLLLRVDGIATLKEAAALTAWSTIETALLIFQHFEAKKDEMRSLRLYTCKTVSEHISGRLYAESQIEGSEEKRLPKRGRRGLPFIPMELSMFYNYKYSNPLFLWPYEKDFNIFVGLKAIDDYIKLRLNWMKNTNFGIRYDHYELGESSINHVYSIVGCNMRYGYPIGQATFNLVFIIISKFVGADPYQRVSVRFFVEGSPVEFIPMLNDEYFTDRLVRHITNRKMRYFCKFHMTDSILHKEHSTEEQMAYKRKLIKNYKKALAVNTALTQKNTVSLPVHAALCGFCIQFDGVCSLHGKKEWHIHYYCACVVNCNSNVKKKEPGVKFYVLPGRSYETELRKRWSVAINCKKCHWDELFTPEAAANAQMTVVRELDNTVRRPLSEIFWPDIKAPIKQLFSRKVLLW